MIIDGTLTVGVYKSLSNVNKTYGIAYIKAEIHKYEVHVAILSAHPVEHFNHAVRPGNSRHWHPSMDVQKPERRYVQQR